VVIIGRDFVISQEVRELFCVVLGHAVEDPRGIWGKAAYDLENELEAIAWTGGQKERCEKSRRESKP
jgi:hypothetical protein